jgi:hypothetical protein
MDESNLENTIRKYFRANNIDLEGFALQDGLGGNKIKIQTEGFLYSSKEMFHIILDQIKNIFSSLDLQKSNDFIIIIHPNKEADIYIDNIDITFKAIPKRSVKKGEGIYKRDIADISDINLEGTNFDKDDKIIWVFRIDWRFGLFFSLYSNRESTTKQDILNKMSACFKRLFYFREFECLENPHITDPLVADGWFPFLHLIGYNLTKLLSCYQTKNIKKRNIRLKTFLSDFTKDEIFRMANKWWENGIYDDKRVLIETGLNNYCENNAAGYIACIKILMSEIEGIVRIMYCKENNTGYANFEQLQKYIKEKGKKKYESNDSLAFPEDFYDYLHNYIFANFDITKDSIDVTRHSANHGVASPNKYTQERALQTILILDQLHYYLS